MKLLFYVGLISFFCVAVTMRISGLIRDKKNTCVKFWNFVCKGARKSFYILYAGYFLLFLFILFFDEISVYLKGEFSEGFILYAREILEIFFGTASVSVAAYISVFGIFKIIVALLMAVIVCCIVAAYYVCNLSESFSETIPEPSTEYPEFTGKNKLYLLNLRLII